MRVGIIDCGSNTFNLLMADVVNARWTEVFQTLQPVFLLKGSSENALAQERIARGLDSIKSFLELSKNYHCQKLWVIGTEALRSNDREQLFKALLQQKFGVELQIIDGDEEARLVQLAAAATAADEVHDYMAVDIGGGSVEFILVINQKVQWRQSLPIGVSRMSHQLNLSLTLTTAEELLFRKTVKEAIKELIIASEPFEVRNIIGISGSFESIQDMCLTREKLKDKLREIPLSAFHRLYARIVHSSHTDRSVTPGLVSYRVDTIVPAMMIIAELIDNLNITHLYHCQYSLLEGFLIDQINKGLC